jgi:glycosyltransferase involved in cell wall biosynthesis
MSISRPLVSIVIPAYNAEKYLADAVRSAQTQDYEHLEVIIVDDGSTDSTPELAKGFAAADARVRVVSQSNGGLSSARNTGLRHARGDFVSFLDSDDTLHPLKVSRQLGALQSTDAGLAFSDYYTADENLVPQMISVTRPYLDDLNEQLPLQNVFPAHAALIRREIVDYVGVFDEGLPSAEDWDYWIRCAKVTAMVYVPGALCCYRLHSGQMHNDRRRMRLSQLRVVRKHYHPGSPQRRLAMAGFHWAEAKYQYSQGHPGRTLLQLLKVVTLTRTPTRTRRVIRLGRYG